MPIDVQIIPELQDALGAGFENIIHELNGNVPQGGSTHTKSPKRKRKVRGGESATSAPIQGGSKKKSKSRRKSSRKRKSVRKSPLRKVHPVVVGPRTAMGYFLERNNQVIVGPYRTKQQAMQAKKRLIGIVNM